MQKAIFLDRDGTIIEDVGYIKTTKEVVFFDNTFDALKILQKDYLFFIVTNQSGIAKYLLTIEEVNNVNNYIVEKLNRESIKTTEVFVCPHKKEDNCKCHKPKPYFLLEATKKYNIGLSNSYVIGDHPSDVYCAENAGANGIYILTGHGNKHLNEFVTRPINKNDILEAANYIKLNKG
ncbi:D-glycero-beta-D-manno-heptose-1,7-bisphosphate 7-phosphatase [hydrothermal vent metagenome]|uniref:D,D-heptose 1,7-bisphosphate phosphatase n=1 Tax=hydrothermal vent metagenome TaxID=652676 RepID=A0A3B1BAB2_9ZZZZ